MKKTTFTLSVEVEYDESEHTYLKVQEMVMERMTVFLYPAGIESIKVQTVPSNSETVP